jgi:hypothetical protein
MDVTRCISALLFLKQFSSSCIRIFHTTRTLGLRLNRKKNNFTEHLFQVLCCVSYECGRAVAQAVSGWLPTAAARVRVWAACGVCSG